MATIKPFTAIRPKPEVAVKLCELPYDVVSTEEARQIAQGREHSFYRISRPEINFPKGIDPYSEVVYAKARDLYCQWLEQGWMEQDQEPCFYLYRQVMGDHIQTGLVAAASCREYQENVIKKHELTRVEKENDRIRHIEALNAQTGPAFLTYRSNQVLNDFFAKKTEEAPVVDFTAPDGIRHESWVISNPEDIKLIENEFAAMNNLYIADGHHRSAAAARIYTKRQGQGGSDCFLAVIFPHDQMQILPYNRLVKDLNGLKKEDFLEKIRKVCAVSNGLFQIPTASQEVGMYLDGVWYGLKFTQENESVTAQADRLDVQILQKQILDPILGIKDPRTSNRIAFVGGIRGTEELEKRVLSGEFACAFSMYPTQIEDVLEIADHNEIMPPKSTWFEPKLRDGMFIYQYEKV